MVLVLKCIVHFSLFFFFFSRQKPDTGSEWDLDSDVCLSGLADFFFSHFKLLPLFNIYYLIFFCSWSGGSSEERRLGKEFRSGGSRYL